MCEKLESKYSGETLNVRRLSGQREKLTYNAAVIEILAILQGALELGWPFRMVSN